MSLYGVIGYHVTLLEGHMITPYKETLVPHLVATLIYLSQIYSYYIRGDRSPLKWGNVVNGERERDYQLVQRINTQNTLDVIICNDILAFWVDSAQSDEQ